MAWSGLTLPKRPVSDQIPVPTVGPIVPKGGLPRWSQLSFDTKLPLPRCPRGAVELTISRLGQKLHKRCHGNDFDITDEHIMFSLGETEYNPLRDPHLRRYFLNLPRFKELVRRGQVTPDGRVRCSLAEYNKYRLYLYRLWGLEVDRLTKHQMKEEKMKMKVRILEAGGKTRKQLKPEYEEAQNRWIQYQRQLFHEYPEKYASVSKWLNNTTKCYRNYVNRRLAAREERERKLREFWAELREENLRQMEEEKRIREREQDQDRRLREKRHRDYEKIWENNYRKLFEHMKRRKSKTKADSQKVQQMIARFRAKRRAEDLEEKPAEQKSYWDVKETLKSTMSILRGKERERSNQDKWTQTEEERTPTEGVSVGLWTEEDSTEGTKYEPESEDRKDYDFESEEYVAEDDMKSEAQEAGPSTDKTSSSETSSNLKAIRDLVTAIEEHLAEDVDIILESTSTEESPSDEPRPIRITIIEGEPGPPSDEGDDSTEREMPLEMDSVIGGYVQLALEAEETRLLYEIGECEIVKAKKEEDSAVMSSVQEIVNETVSPLYFETAEIVKKKVKDYLGTSGVELTRNEIKSFSEEAASELVKRQEEVIVTRIQEDLRKEGEFFEHTVEEIATEVISFEQEQMLRDVAANMERTEMLEPDDLADGKKSLLQIILPEVFEAVAEEATKRLRGSCEPKDFWKDEMADVIRDLLCEIIQEKKERLLEVINDRLQACDFLNQRTRLIVKLSVTDAVLRKREADDVLRGRSSDDAESLASDAIGNVFMKEKDKIRQQVNENIETLPFLEDSEKEDIKAAIEDILLREVSRLQTTIRQSMGGKTENLKTLAVEFDVSREDLELIIEDLSSELLRVEESDIIGVLNETIKSMANSKTEARVAESLAAVEESVEKTERDEYIDKVLSEIASETISTKKEEMSRDVATCLRETGLLVESEITDATEQLTREILPEIFETEIILEEVRVRFRQIEDFHQNEPKSVMRELLCDVIQEKKENFLKDIGTRLQKYDFLKDDVKKALEVSLTETVRRRQRDRSAKGISKSSRAEAVESTMKEAFFNILSTEETRILQQAGHNIDSLLFLNDSEKQDVKKTVGDLVSGEITKLQDKIKSALGTQLQKVEALLMESDMSDEELESLIETLTSQVLHAEADDIIDKINEELSELMNSKMRMDIEEHLEETATEIFAFKEQQIKEAIFEHLEKRDLLDTPGIRKALDQLIETILPEALVCESEITVSKVKQKLQAEEVVKNVSADQLKLVPRELLYEAVQERKEDLLNEIVNRIHVCDFLTVDAKEILKFCVAEAIMKKDERKLRRSLQEARHLIDESIYNVLKTEKERIVKKTIHKVETLNFLDADEKKYVKEIMRELLSEELTKLQTDIRRLVDPNLQGVESLILESDLSDEEVIYYAHELTSVAVRNEADEAIRRISKQLENLEDAKTKECVETVLAELEEAVEEMERREMMEATLEDITLETISFEEGKMLQDIASSMEGSGMLEESEVKEGTHHLLQVVLPEAMVFETETIMDEVKKRFQETASAEELSKKELKFLVHDLLSQVIQEKKEKLLKNIEDRLRNYDFLKGKFKQVMNLSLAIAAFKKESEAMRKCSIKQPSEKAKALVNDAIDNLLKRQEMVVQHQASEKLDGLLFLPDEERESARIAVKSFVSDEITKLRSNMTRLAYARLQCLESLILRSAMSEEQIERLIDATVAEGLHCETRRIIEKVDGELNRIQKEHQTKAAIREVIPGVIRTVQEEMLTSIMAEIVEEIDQESEAYIEDDVHAFVGEIIARKLFSYEKEILKRTYAKVIQSRLKDVSEDFLKELVSFVITEITESQKIALIEEIDKKLADFDYLKDRREFTGKLKLAMLNALDLKRAKLNEEMMFEFAYLIEIKTGDLLEKTHLEEYEIPDLIEILDETKKNLKRHGHKKQVSSARAKTENEVPRSDSQHQNQQKRADAEKENEQDTPDEKHEDRKHQTQE